MKIMRPSIDSKIVVILVRQRFVVNIAYPSELWTLPQPIAQRVDGSFLAASQYLHPPIRQVANITRDAQPQGLFDGGIAETNTLDTAADLTTQAKGFHETSSGLGMA
mgnify:CR=1 FL=1